VGQGRRRRGGGAMRARCEGRREARRARRRRRHGGGAGAHGGSRPRRARLRFALPPPAHLGCVRAARTLFAARRHGATLCAHRRAVAPASAMLALASPPLQAPLVTLAVRSPTCHHAHRELRRRRRARGVGARGGARWTRVRRRQQRRCGAWGDSRAATVLRTLAHLTSPDGGTTHLDGGPWARRCSIYALRRCGGRQQRHGGRRDRPRLVARRHGASSGAIKSGWADAALLCPCAPVIRPLHLDGLGRLACVCGGAGGVPCARRGGRTAPCLLMGRVAPNGHCGSEACDSGTFGTQCGGGDSRDAMPAGALRQCGEPTGGSASGAVGAKASSSQPAAERMPGQQPAGRTTAFALRLGARATAGSTPPRCWPLTPCPTCTLPGTRRHERSGDGNLSLLGLEIFALCMRACRLLSAAHQIAVRSVPWAPSAPLPRTGNLGP
jgi:hypothetical protein